MRRIAVALCISAALAFFVSPAAQAVQSDLTIFIDFDNNPATGCNDFASGFLGYDQRVVTTVDTTTGPNAALVTQIEGFDCSNTQVFFDGTDHPVGIGNGDLGFNVVETYWPISPNLQPPPIPCQNEQQTRCIRVGAFAQNANGGSDALITTNGAPNGEPIVFLVGGFTEIPTLSQWGLLLLVLLLAGAAMLKLRRRPLRALLTVVLILGAGGVAFAVYNDLDGTTINGWGPLAPTPNPFRLAHDPAAVDDGDDIASLYGRTHVPSQRVYFRLDASLVFNTPPVVTTTAGSTAFTEDGGPVVVDGGVTVTDADSANLASATVTITNPQDGALETLAAGACAGITVTPGVNSLALSGSATVAAYQSCFQSVTYNNSSQNPTAAPSRVVRFVANDGAASSAPADKTVTVAPQNDAPVVTTTAGNTTFTEDAGPVVVDGGVTVSDVDNANLASATVTITNPQDGGSEQLNATACAGLTVGGTGTATLNISGSQPLATYQACLQSVTYDNTAQNPTTAPDRIISFVANDGTAASAAANKTVTITPDPDAPVVTTTAGNTAFTEDGGAVVVDGGVTVTDPDDANLASATVTITNPQDGAAEQLNATSCAGLTVGGGGTSTLNISGSQPLATYQTCLQSVTYNNTSQNPTAAPDRVVSFVASDGTNSSAPANKTVTVGPVNDAPVVTTTGGNTAFTEDGGPVVVDAGVTVTDVDNANLASATVTITNPQDGASEVLAAGACAGITVTPGLNSLALSGSATVAAYQSCFQSVTYNNTSQNPTAAPDRVVRFVANDGTANSNNGDKTVTVAAQADAPVVTTTGGITAFTEDGGPVVVDAGVTVTDADDPNLASATVTITNPQDGVAEVLAAGACAGITVTPGVNSLALSGSATVAAYQSCFQSVTYNNTSQNPTAAPNRIVRFIANDGTNNSNNGDKQVSVAPLNDAPVVTTTGGVTAFTEDAGAVVVDSGVTVTDVDNANLASATVTITNPQDGVAEVLAAGACAGITVTPGVNSLALSGSATVAAYQACFQSVTYNNTSQNPTAAPNRIVRFVANDGTANSNDGDKQVSVAPQNDAPVVTTTGGNTAFTEDGGAVVVDSGVTVTDADNANLASATVTLAATPDGAAEQLNATACAGLTVGGGGTSTLNISGSQPLATYQACLQSVTYNNTSQNPNNANRTVNFTVNDGTANSNTAGKTVTVAAQNDAPVVTTTGGNTAFVEDGGAVVVDSGVTVTDVDNANLASATVALAATPDGAAEQLNATSCAGLTVGGTGTSTLNISGSQPLATYQTCLQSVTYNNTSQNPNTTNRTVNFTVNDGTANSNTAGKTVTVAVNDDAPVVTTTGGNTAFTEDGGAVVVDAGVTVSDVDSTNLVSATVAIAATPDGAAEQLNATSCAGLTVGGGGTSTLNISGSQPVATYQTCLQSVTYNNTDQDPSNANRTVNFTVNDGTSNSNTAGKTVTVTPVNDPPVVTTTGGITSFIEDGGAVVIDSGVTVTDVDNANLTSGSVAIATTFDGAFEQLNFNAGACAGLTMGGAGTATITLSGSQPLATYQACLQSVTYNNLDQAPDAANRTLNFQVNDGAAASNVAPKTVSVTPVNDPPTCANAVNYTTPGNTQLHVGSATTPGVAFWADAVTILTKCAPTDPDGPVAASVVAASGNSTNGGPFTVDASGNFHFVPATGSVAADTFGYQLTDTVTPSNQTVNITIGPRVWYIHDVTDANNPAAGDTGRSNNPFDTIAEFNAATTFDNDIIFVFEGNTATTPHVGQITLRNGQKLLGQGIPLNVPGFGTLVAAANQARIRTTAASTDVVSVPATAGNRQNVEIQGLDLEATGATSNAIDVTASGGNAVGILIRGNIVRGATAEGVDLNAGATAAFDATVDNSSITAAGNAVDVRNNGTGTATVTVASNTISSTAGNAVDARTLAGASALRLALANLTITASGTGILVDGSAAGTTTITSFTNHVINGNTGGTGINVSAAIFDQTPGGTFQVVNAGTLSVGTAGNGVGGAGVVLGGVAGDLSFSNVGIVADSGAGLSATGTTAYTGSAGFQITITTPGSAEIAATGGPGVSLDTVSGSLPFLAVGSTNTPSTGVSLVNFADGGAAALFSAGNGRHITTTAGATGPIFNVSGGNAQITYGGNVTNSAGGARTISVDSWTGDDAGDNILFSGAIASGNAGGPTDGGGILLNNNAGAGRNVTFSGGINIFTSGTAANDEAFAATSNTFSGGLHVTGTNILEARSATALRVTSTTIGNSDITFQTISSGNATAAADPVSGIILNATGTLGGLKVTGSGVSGQGGNGSGGLIQSTTSHGVSLTSTREPSFANLTIQNIVGSGINGASVTDFTYDNGTITNVGTGGGVDTSNIAFGAVSAGVNNLSGVVVITDSILNTARYHGIDIYNESGTISSITVTGNSLTSATGVANSQGSGIRVNANGSAGGASVITTGTFSNNSITNFPMGVGIQVQGGNAALGPPAGLGDPTSGVNMITIANNAIAGSGATANVDALGSNAIQTAMTGTGNAKFFINANGTVATPVRNFLGIGVSCSGGNLAVIECTVSNNVIDATANIASSSGIAVGSQLGVGQTGSITALIENNSVTGMEGNGILAGVTNSNNSGNFTIRGNTIGNPTGGVRPGIRVESGSASGDTTLCLNMHDNASGSSGGHAGLGIRKQGSVATTNDFGIVGLVPSPGTCGNAEDRVSSLNPGTNPGTVNTGSDCDGNPGSKTLAISGSNYVSCSVVLP